MQQFITGTKGYIEEYKKRSYIKIDFLIKFQIAPLCIKNK